MYLYAYLSPSISVHTGTPLPLAQLRTGRPRPTGLHKAYTHTHAVEISKAISLCHSARPIHLSLAARHGEVLRSPWRELSTVHSHSDAPRPSHVCPSRVEDPNCPMALPFLRDLPFGHESVGELRSSDLVRNLVRRLRWLFFIVVPASPCYGRGWGIELGKTIDRRRKPVRRLGLHESFVLFRSATISGF
jgi:hypothetical protein